MWLLVSSTANAQSASDSEKIEKLERQTELMQRQLKELKEELARTRRKAEQQQPQPQPQQIETVSADYPVAPHAVAKAKAPPPPEKVKVTLGGFVAAETVWRQHNAAAEMGTPFGAIPYPFSPLYNETEFHGSARQSRISLLIEGNIDPVQKLSGYFETDFLGVGNTSNYNQSNSWAPRLRQAYLTYDNNSAGFHLLAGQSWSLATPFQVGITPRKENIPLTIDANYVVGFNYTRNWQIRFVEQFAPWFTAGVSVENPATIFGGSIATGPLGLGGAFNSGTSVVNGLEVNFVNTGNSFLNGVAVATDNAPDIIGKLAFDPGWGHYEVFGIQRFFTDNVLACVAGPCATGSITNTGTPSTKTSLGGGVGGSMLVPVIPKWLEFTGNILYGRGVGRYAAGQLPDVTIASDGSLTPLTELAAMVGLIAHPWEGLDVYGYAGFERVDANFFNIGPTFYGYGNPGFSNAGCNTTTANSFSGTTPANCIANNRRLSDVTVGFWQNIYKGDYGRLAVGAQYEYIKRESFDGVGGAVSTGDSVVLTSLRYYPF
jgi:hypothetical protein